MENGELQNDFYLVEFTSREPKAVQVLHFDGSEWSSDPTADNCLYHDPDRVVSRIPTPDELRTQAEELARLTSENENLLLASRYNSDVAQQAIDAMKDLRQALAASEEQVKRLRQRLAIRWAADVEDCLEFYLENREKYGLNNALNEDIGDKLRQIAALLAPEPTSGEKIRVVADQISAAMDDAWSEPAKPSGTPQSKTEVRRMALQSSESSVTPEGSGICHGYNCPKVIHDMKRGGYLHGELDDSPYDVDGVEYCGRCHGDPAAPQPEGSGEDGK